MAIASLYPTIKPSLLLDFANSKKLDPRVTFTRSTTATYYDGVTTAKAEENLLLQSQVFLPAPWTLTDADPTGTLGPELVTNGDFSSGSTGWTLGAGWSIVGGAASNDGSGAGQLRQTGLTYVAGKTYKITFAVTVAASAVNVVMETTNIGLVSSSGSYTFYFTANANAFNRIYFQPNGGYIGTIDDVSVKELTVTYVTAPDGTTTATELTADAANATFTQSVTAISAEYTFSVYLRRVTGTGNIDITCDSAGTWVTQTITSSWARYTVTQTLTAGTCTPGIRIVTSGDQIEVWGAQLEQRSAATAYTPTTTQPITNYVPQLLTAPAGVPRFDHVPEDNPTTGQKAGESLGLLIEEQRTNLLTYSEQFNNAAWNPTRAQITANDNISPNGTQTADKIVCNTNGYFYVSRSITTTNSTLSCFVKRINSDLFTLDTAGATNSDLATFNLSTGSVVSVGSNNVSANIVPVGNGWYRCSVSRGSTSGATIYIGKDAGTTSDAFYIWGAQLEAGTFPTSYIPTTSASVTRTEDGFAMRNIQQQLNASQGVLLIDMPFAVGGLANQMSVALANTDAGTQTSVAFWRGSGIAPRYRIYTDSVLRVDDTANLYEGAKWAFQWGPSGTIKFAKNGSITVSTLQPFTMPSSLDRLLIGAIGQKKYVKKIAVYPQVISDAQLQALTA